VPSPTSPEYREDLEQYARKLRMELPHPTYIEKALKLIEDRAIQVECFRNTSTPTFEALIELAKKLMRISHPKIALSK
jgi:hypothetical protein